MFDSIRSRWDDLLENHPWLESVVSLLGGWLPPINYITIHYAYFIVSTLVISAILWGSNNPHGNIEFIDCLFLVTSSITNTGLNTVDLSRLTTWQQVLLWLSFIVGSVIWVSFWTVLARKHAFEKRFEDIVRAEREDRKRHAAQKDGVPGRQYLSFDKFRVLRQNTMNIITGSRVNLPESGKDNKVANGPEAVLSSDGLDRRMTLVPEASFSDEENPSRSTTIAPEDEATPNRVQFSPSFGRADRRAQKSIYQHGNQDTNGEPRRPATANSAQSNESGDFFSYWKSIVTKDNVTKRGQFYDLSSEERDALGGCEYRALKVLAVVVPLYSLLWQMIPGIALGAWIAVNKADAAKEYGANPWWAGIFLSGSAFNNTGMSVIDPGMSIFISDYFVLIVVGVLVIAGNTGYPLFLRFILWSILKILNLTTSSEYGPWRDTIEFILKYPRRVYTTLFPSGATWWLLLVLVLINTIDWVAFEVLNIGNPVVENLSTADAVFAGWFQAIAVRAAGFAVLSISSLYPAVQLLYMVMMYISVYPVSITMRHSNVYEERSLGIYEDDPSLKEEENGISTTPSKDVDLGKKHLRRRATAAVTSELRKSVKRSMTFQGVGVNASPKKGEDNSRISFIGQQIRGQLAHDLWWLIVPLIIIMIIETRHFLDTPLDYSIFNIMFEVVSAYACVGLSIGYPGSNSSFSGSWHTGSKFVLCIVMLRGRHRGLPVALDKAVRLPGEKQYKEEEEDMTIRRRKTMAQLATREI